MGKRREPEPGCRVYVVRLGPEAGHDKKQREANPDKDPDKPWVYVGQSVKSADERFRQHKDGVRSARLVRKYGESLMTELYDHLGPLIRRDAEAAEARLAHQLREEGYGAWYR